MPNTITIVRPSESCHWYGIDGSPQYERTAKNGNQRATTLADARKENLVPSVSTILKVAARPSLEKWIQNQILLAALTLPRIENELEEKWIARVIEDSSAQAKKAAELGTSIHAAVQGYYEGESVSEEMKPYALPAIQAIKERYGEQEWQSERSFAHPLRYGGKVDLSCSIVVNDFKTKAFTEEDAKKGLSYDEHIMQLAAYRIGLGLEGAQCANTFISTTVPGLVHIEEYDQYELLRAWGMFQDLLSFWKKKNKF